MAIMKCKMCGGDLDLIPGQSVAECEYCGSRQTVPAADNEKKLTLFARANRLRAACEFDKAAGIYESIVADFPEEAEAYWGLVLCKYGIEYVDDPATGKKIPTCHRSSFDSVMDDGNFEQAMENADEAALRVYRQEAKQIEGIRKGILEVSSSQQPYDIFICYKETASDGDRTVDSLLAQDIYDALTARGYRVFFSRITLEDKLGQAYEPYIFAALNSAKIMLAVGTCYEHYNAVWVKNEWSRYLKIIAQDKNKYLIPCYKNIDAYDMPKEFAHLQGQDMGRVGAIQDLLRGVEKILPSRKPVAVVQERVVVGGSGDNKIASLLDRGNMALEDGDWAKADSFFEDVLNNDSKNAQAYLGKTLAMERCRTMDAFARKRKDAFQNVRGEKLELQPNHAHVDEMAAQFSLPGYVDKNVIRKLYDFDLGYHSDVAERKQQYQNEEKYWTNHKQLSRAEKFAAGAVAENLANEKQALFAVLSDRVKKAEAAEAAAKQDVRERYDAHLKQADEKAEKLYNDALNRRENHYQELLSIAKTSSDVAQLTDAAKKFDQLGSYQDSKNLAEHCRKRAGEEQAKLDAEAQRLRVLKEKQDKKRRAKITKIAILAGVAAVVVLVASFVIGNMVKANQEEQARMESYTAAMELLQEKNYDAAIELFLSLGAYKDSSEQIEIARNEKTEAENAETYRQAQALLEDGAWKQAADLFAQLGDYKDSAQLHENALLEGKYIDALSLLRSGQQNHGQARELFLELGEYKDSAEYASNFVERALSRVNYSGSRGREYKFTYDAAGYVISEDNKQIFWDASHRQMTYTTIKQTYDEEGKITHWSNVYTDGSGSKSEFTYTYHDDGTVATRTETNVSMGPNGGNEHLFYDAVTSYEYNSQGLLIKEVKELSFALYREKGENTTMVNTIVYSYDENGRLIKEAEEQVSYNRYSGDVKVSSSNYTREYTYGWVYAPEAEGHPTIFWGSGIKTT